MSTDPVARILTSDPREHASWEALAELSGIMPSGWSLAGGSLVRLHLEERGGDGARVTRDIDLVLDVRASAGCWPPEAFSSGSTGRKRSAWSSTSSGWS